MKQLFLDKKSNKINKGQIVFMLVGLFLIFFVFLIIILGNITNNYLQFSVIFRNFITLRSLALSGLTFALFQINQNPSFTTSSGIINMPQGYFNYSVSDFYPDTKIINIEAFLNNSNLSKNINATTTIDVITGKILNVEINEN